MSWQNGNLSDLRELVPQRPPFLFVDGISELSEEQILTEKLITAGDYVTLSGSFLVEHMAQSASALFGYRFREKHCEHMYLAGIDEARIFRMLRPGETVYTEVSVVIAAGSLARVKCKSYVTTELGEQELVASAVLILYVA